MVALIAVLAAGAAAQQNEAFWIHPYNYFGPEEALTASVSLGDLDGDGDLDGFAVNGRHWIQQNEVFLNNGGGFFRSAHDAGSLRDTGYAADLNGDGHPDLAFSNRGGEGLPVYRGLAEGGFAEPEMIGSDLDLEIRALAMGDVNGDGFPDLVAGGMQAQSVLFVNDGQVGFEDTRRFGS